MERGPTNYRQEFRREAVNIHLQFGIRVHDENIKERETLVNAICKKLANPLSLSANQFRILKKIIATSRELSIALGNRAEVHSLITIKN